ncbi:MAG: protein-L-isoaspartate(D-aspartate) O-methyltransferase [Candidatus Omnitrophica bacterium]|nr:protein-L-isoaspartate(D-aspartate) O-methyltransferase [Candidatus Omnitrophota bacterium]MBU4590130.1 protein-L-isoaspartate(D-aspartate) O-methyltransferase [Candidatus Omnitrophota bacterium]
MRYLLILFIIFAIVNSVIAEDVDFFSQRKMMVEQQIQKRGVSDKKVLDAMLKVERHVFVPSDVRNLSYIDSPLPIGKGQTISQPYIVALMTELADLKVDDRVLEIGTGSGYQAAILAELSEEVYTIEIIPELAKRAEKLLKELAYDNIKVREGDGYLGWPEYAPFDVIMVTAAPPAIPEKLIEQLAEGGRMVTPVGEAGNQVLRLLIKKQGDVVEENIIPVRFVPMVHE